MSKNKSSVSKAQSYKEIGEYWDKHDIAEHWEETKPAEFGHSFKFVVAREITRAEYLKCNRTNRFTG